MKQDRQAEQEDLLAELERELQAEAARVRSHAGRDLERLQQLASQLMERLMSEQERMAANPTQARLHAAIRALQRVLEPICGPRAAAGLLESLRHAKPQSVAGHMTTLRSRAGLVYGMRVAQMVDAVLLKLEWQIV